MPDTRGVALFREVMALPGRLWRRLQMIARRDALDGALREEMEHHRDMLVRSLLAQGLSATDARHQASLRLGNVTVARERARRFWSVRLLDSLAQDLVFALRGMRRHKVLTGVVLLALAGGIGVGTSAFALWNTIALRSWNVREAERLVALYATAPGVESKRASGFSLNELRVFARRARTLDGVFAYERRRPDGTDELNPAPVTANYFDVMGVQMARGRGFRSDDDDRSSPRPVVVLSDAYWRDRLHAAPDAVGSTVVVNNVALEVIGVAPPQFSGTDLVRLDAWMPIAAMPLVHPHVSTSRTALSDPDACCLHLAARLAPGVTADDASVELTSLLTALRRDVGGTPGQHTVQVSPYTMLHSSGPAAGREIMPAIALLAGSALMVLLLSCGNAANLLLARTLAREHEVRIRLALGASRARLIRQFLTESLLLSAMAGLPALAIARWLPPWLLEHATGVPVALPFAADLRTLLVAIALVLSCGVLFGLVPALLATRTQAPPASPSSISPWLVGLQMACCTTVLLSAEVLVAAVSDGPEGRRLSVALSALTTGFVSLMAATGVFGVLWYGIQQRRRDIGLRLALGASPIRLAIMLVGWLGRATVSGMLAGLAIAASVVIALRYGLNAEVPLPLLPLAQVIAALTALVLLAVSLPLWRAIRMPPAPDLHCD